MNAGIPRPPLSHELEGRLQGHVAMAIRVVRLGSERCEGEGLRIGTVRWPPRAVPKAELASRDLYDVWLPNLAPEAQTVKLARAADTPQAWNTFVRRYRREMAKPENSRVIDVLAALSHTADFSVGCYCVDEARCHRSVLRELLRDRGAVVK